MSFDRRRAWLRAAVVALVWVLGCNVDALFEAGRGPDPAPPRLVFAPPPDGTAGEPLSPAVQVSAQDSAGTVDTSFDAVVTVTLGANPGLGTLRGTTKVNATRGVATFADLTINKAAQGYTLVATAPGARGATSPTFDVTPAAAARLEFTTQPHSTMAGNVIAPPVQVTAFDTLENVVASFTGNVTMALGTNPTATTLGGTTTVPAANGVATFADLRISEAGRYTLTASASASGLASATSDAFDITPGPPPPTGNLTVTTSTTGSSRPTSYTVTVDGDQSRTILANGGSVTYEGLTATTHTVALTDVPANCTVSRGASHTVTVIANQTITEPFSISCVATTGSLTVTTTTSGQSQDPDGYTFAVDAGTLQPIGLRDTITLTVATGSHTVVLSGVAGNCTVANGTTRTVNVPAGAADTASFSISCVATTGSLTVATNTSGQSQDPDGYTFAVDAGTLQPIGLRDTLTLTVAIGSHTVVLSGVAGNCTVANGTSRTVNVPAGGADTASFAISCAALTGNLTVTTTTTGSSQPTTYTVTVDGSQNRPINANGGTTTYTGLSATSHTVALIDVPANCTVSGGASHPVTVIANQTITEPFSISCVATTGSLDVSTTTSGPDQPSGYTVSVSGGGGASRSIGTNQTITFNDLTPGGHTVTLSGAPSNCTVSNGTSHPVTVNAGETANTSFSISCVATTGNLTVTTSTTGSDQPSSYTVTVDGSQSRPINANGGTTTYTGLSATSHTVALIDVPANCTVSGGASHPVTVIANQTITEPFSISCVATTGSLDVSTTTSGPDQPSGYTVSVSGGGGASRSIGTNQTITFNALATGSHTVTLSGVPGNCSVTGGTSRPVTVNAGETATADFSISCISTTGTLTVTTSTSGDSPDPNGYTFTVDNGSPQPIGTDATIPLTGVSTGNHTVVLGGLASNCSVTNGSTSRTVNVPAGGTGTASFTIDCPTPTGTLTVTTSTSGGSPDPNGYTFTVDNGTPQPIGTDATIPLTGVSTGNHTVVLGGLASNCSVTNGSTSRTVNVPAGGTGTASFTIDCPTPPPPTGSLTVTTNTSGGTPDPNGYTVTVSGGGGGSRHIDNDGSETFTDLAAGSHNVTLSDIAPNCSVSGGTQRTVNVPAGGSTSESFSVDCPTPPPPNRPPSVSAGLNQDVLVGLLFTLEGASFSDPDHNGPWTVTIDWGDGTSPATFTASEGSINASHNYLTVLPATYTLTITVTDRDGLSDSASKTVRVTTL